MKKQVPLAKRLWLITDLHHNHEGMVTLCGRPKNFSERIVKHWKSHVSPKDTIVCLGDICIGNDKEVHEKYIQPLPGFKILVRGNHDRRTDGWYEGHGWDVCCDRIQFDRFGKRVLLSHKPPSASDDYDFACHGHWHNTVTSKDYSVDGKRYCLSLEYEEYKPILLQTFMERVLKPKKLAGIGPYKDVKRKASVTNAAPICL